MACQGKPLDPEGRYIGTDVIVTCILLLLCMILSLAGNIWVLIKFGTPSTKKYHQGDTMIPRSIAVLGMVHTLLNTPVYMASIIAGRWIFGTVFCQLFGFISSITLGTWMWFFALASMERFYKIVVPNEYSSMFSDINTKILLWGTVLFVAMVFTGPIYGWAEYSDKRGAAQILLVSIPKEPSSLPPLNQFFATHSNNSQLIQAMLRNISAFFQTSFHSELRLTGQNNNEFSALLRSRSREQVMCLWSHINNKSIDSLVGRFFNNSEGVSKEDSELFTVKVEESMYTMYSNRTLTYQESVTCGLDFSQVNKHIYSFLGFCSVLLLIIPVITNSYFFFRTKCFSLRSVIHKKPHRRNILHEKDMFISNSYALSTVITFLFQVAFLAINILAGLNTSLSKWTYLTSYLLLYACSLSLSISLAVLKICDFIWAILCCCTDKNLGHDQKKSLATKTREEGYADMEMVNICKGGVNTKSSTVNKIGAKGGLAGRVNSTDASGCDSDLNPNSTEATILIGNGNTESTQTSLNYFATDQ